LKKSPTFILGISSLGFWIDGKFYFTNKSLQFCEIAYRPLGNSTCPSSLLSLILALFLFLSPGRPSLSLLLSLFLSSVRGALPQAARALGAEAGRAGSAGASRRGRARGADAMSKRAGDAGEQRAGHGRGESRRAVLARGASAAVARSEVQVRAGGAEAERSVRRGRGSAWGGSVWARTGAGGARAGRRGIRVGHGRGAEADVRRSAGTGAHERWRMDTSRRWRRAARLAV
jgi:hypothetical protein